MASKRYPLIAKEGWAIIFVSSVMVGLLHYYVSIYFVILWLLPLYLLWIHRDPARTIPPQPLAVVSPIDGVVERVENHPDPYLGRDAVLFRVCMRLSDVFSVRSVIEGKIIQQWLDPEEDDEHALAHAIQIQTDEKDDVMVVLRPGRLFKRLNCDALIGDRVGQGHRCGFIALGSCVDIYVPKESAVLVKVGEVVQSGSSVLARLRH